MVVIRPDNIISASIYIRLSQAEMTACASVPLAGFGSARAHVVHTDGFVLYHDTDNTVKDIALPFLQRLPREHLTLQKTSNTAL